MNSEFHVNSKLSDSQKQVKTKKIRESPSIFISNPSKKHDPIIVQMSQRKNNKKKQIYVKKIISSS